MPGAPNSSGFQAPQSDPLPQQLSFPNQPTQQQFNQSGMPNMQTPPPVPSSASQGLPAGINADDLPFKI